MVVLERVGEAGEKFHSVLESGGDPPSAGLLRWLLGKPSVYFAFAVDASRNRPLNFDELVHMSERAHKFQLHFTLWYRVSDPQLLVAARDLDPLGRVRKHVADIITEEVADLSWSEVWHSFRPAGERVVDSTLQELKAFARDYGIVINSLRLKPHFDDDAARYEREIHDTRERGRVLEARMTVTDDVKNRRWELRRDGADRDREDRDHARRTKLEDTVYEKYDEFLRGTTSVDDLGYAIRSLPGGTTNGVLGSGASAPSLALASGNGHASPAPAATGDRLAAVLNDLLTLSMQIDTEAQRRQAQAALLHVVASVVAQDSPQVTPEQNGFARQAQTVLASAGHLPPDYLERMRELANPQTLRSRLY